MGLSLVSTGARDKDQHCGGHRWASPPALSKPDPVNPFCAELEKPLTIVTPTAQKAAVHPSPTRFSRAAICCAPGAALRTFLFLSVGRGHSEPQAHRLASAPDTQAYFAGIQPTTSENPTREGQEAG